MNSKFWKRIKFATALGSLLAITSILNACGGGSDGDDLTAGIGGTGIVYGRVTDFGSVFVNGRKFETNGVQFIVDDDENAVQGDLNLGMVLRLKVETLDGIYTGNAIQVVYDDEIEGPVANTPVLNPDGSKTFQIFDRDVTVDEIGTLFEGTSFDTIAAGDVLEVSGYVGPTSIVATYIEWKGTLPGTTEAELQGPITAPPGANSFTMGGVTVTYDLTDLEPGLVLQQGIDVEVRGTYVSQSSLDATEIKLEDDGFGDNADDVEIEGIVSQFVDINTDFYIGTQLVNAGSAQIEPVGAVIANGVEIEAEGDIIGGTLFADEIELEEEEVKLRSYVNPGSVGADSFEVRYATGVILGSVVVKVDTETTFEDETGATSDLTLGDLSGGDYVRIEGRELISGEVLAKVVKRTSAGDSLKLEGKVTGYVLDTSITVLGITYGLDGSTVYDPDKNIIVGVDIVEIEDDDNPVPADGIADKIEVE